jgi:hypothetical protein
VTSSTAVGSLTLTPGTYALSATVTDIRGGTASTGPVTFTVVQAPVVTISAPVSGASIAIVNGVTTAPVAYSISATAPTGSTFPSAASASASLTVSGGGSTSGFSPVFVLAGGSGSVSASGTANLGPGSYTLNASATNSLGAVGTASPASFTVTAPPTTTTSSVSATFNSSAIAKGNYLWFSGVIKVQGVPTAGTSVLLSNATVSFVSGGKTVTVAVPSAVIDFASGTTAATTTYSTTTGTWTTTVPANYAGNIFLSGVAYQAPSAMSGSLSNVTWSGTFSAANAGITAQWQWGAANYSSFTTSPGSLGVKPVDDNKTSQYKTSDNAGTPESFIAYVTSGGTGAGGTSTTGSYVSSAQFILPDYNL